MNRSTRMGAALALALIGAATPALAQIEGMPLFTNPRYGTGLRVHADVGQYADDAPNGEDLRVLQAGVTLALGPIGLGANVGQTKQNFDASPTCRRTPTLDCADQYYTVSALAQLRVAGGGASNLSLSLFGGASMQLDTSDAFSGGKKQNKELHIPLGVAVGLRIPLGVASLSLWGAPRYNLTRFVNCTGACPKAPDGSFGWAVGADFPVFRVFSIRAAYDSHEDINGETVNVIGVGASIGIGGMR